MKKIRIVLFAAALLAILFIAADKLQPANCPSTQSTEQMTDSKKQDDTDKKDTDKEQEDPDSEPVLPDKVEDAIESKSILPEDTDADELLEGDSDWPFNQESEFDGDERFSQKKEDNSSIVTVPDPRNDI